VVIPIGDLNPVRSTPWVTRLLLVANVGVFLFAQPQTWMEGACAQLQFFVDWAAIPREIAQGAPLSGDELAALDVGCTLRPAPGKTIVGSAFASMFLHADLLHLGGNMLYLWIFGNNVEDRLGHVRFALFYVVVGLLATMAFVVPNADSPITLVGASGAVAGVLGAYLVMFPTARVTVLVLPLFFLALQLPAVLVLGLWFVFQLQDFGVGPVGGGGVAYLAHVAGFLAGGLGVSGRSASRGVGMTGADVHDGRGVAEGATPPRRAVAGRPEACSERRLAQACLDAFQRRAVVGAISKGARELVVLRGLLRSALPLEAASDAEVGVGIGGIEVDRSLELVASLADTRGREVGPAQRLVQRRLPRLVLDGELQHLRGALGVPTFELAASLLVEVVHERGVAGSLRHANPPSRMASRVSLPRPRGGRPRPPYRGALVVDAAPFEAVRYDPSVTGDPAGTSAPAYDDVEPLTYAAHRTASPYTVLELLASRGDEAYRSAAATYERWLRTGVLVQDREPAFYIYDEHELRAGVPAVQRGVLAAVALEPFSRGAVLPHEEVVAARVQERLERVDAVPLDVSPVFGVYRGASDQLRQLLSAPPRRPPLVAITDERGTDHRLWPVHDADEIAVIRQGLAPVRVVIADGHHRYATALAHRERMRGTDGAVGLPDARRPWERILMYLVDVDADGPRLEAIHRTVQGLPDDAPARLAPLFRTEQGPADPAALARAVTDLDGAIGVWRPHTPTLLLHPHAATWTQPTWPSGRSPRWRTLPSAVVEHVLEPLLGLRSVTPWIDPVRAAADVTGRRGGALLVLPPVDASTVLELAARGEPMPAKTTSFRPKPRTGLVMRRLDG
jgi:membrane associated rhomboid family serine protease